MFLNSPVSKDRFKYLYVGPDLCYDILCLKCIDELPVHRILYVPVPVSVYCVRTDASRISEFMEPDGSLVSE
jgi:hypothetical protein